jgi:hypothetical protein
MSVEETKQRFIENVKLRAYDDKFIDSKEEKQLLEYGIDNGLSLEQSRTLLIQAAEQLDYAVESVAEKKAEEMLEQFAGNDGVIDKKEFSDAVSIMKKALRGKLADQVCQVKTKQIVLKHGWKVKEGFLRGGSWFSSI